MLYQRCMELGLHLQPQMQNVFIGAPLQSLVDSHLQEHHDMRGAAGSTGSYTALLTAERGLSHFVRGSKANPLWGSCRETILDIRHVSTQNGKHGTE